MLPAILGSLDKPEFNKVIETLNQAGQEQQKLGKESANFSAEMKRLGFPSGAVGGGGKKR